VSLTPARESRKTRRGRAPIESLIIRPVPSRSLIPTLRSALARRDVRALARAARAAGPEGLVSAWPKLSSVARVAAFRALDARSRAKVFAALPSDARWVAYLGCTSEGAAPLLEGASAASRRELRAPTAREIAAMRRALVEGRA
jgi:hypothetical protein